VKCSVYVVGEV